MRKTEELNFAMGFHLLLNPLTLGLLILQFKRHEEAAEVTDSLTMQ